MRDLANLLGIYDPDPRAREALCRELAASREFDEILEPVSGWVVAVRLFPGARADGFEVRENRMVFAEGRDEIMPPHAGDPSKFWKTLGDAAEDSPNHLAHYPGDFGFVRFALNGRATVVRSIGGVVPFYLWHGASRLIFSTRLGDVLRFANPRPDFDPLPNLIWTANFGVFPNRRSFFKGVTVLRRAHYAIFEPHRGTVTAPYWNPRPSQWTKPTPASRQEHIQRLREILLENLSRDLGKNNLLTLSGGVDSSALGALAAGVLGKNVGAWTLFPQNETVYQRERKFVESLTSKYSFARKWEERMDGLVKMNLLRQAPKICFPVPHPALGALPAVHAEWPVDVMFGGEFGDEACGSYFTLPDWCDALSLVDVFQQWNRWPVNARNLGGWFRRRASQWLGRFELPFPADLPDYLRPEFRKEFLEWRAEEERKISLDQRPWRFLALRADQDGFAAMNWEVCSALQIRRSFPFYTRRVLELVYQCHPTELIGPGWKRILKAALGSDLPELIQRREDRGHWGKGYQSQFLSISQPLPPEMEQWILPTILKEKQLPELWACSLEQLSLFISTVHRRGSSQEMLV